MDLLQVNQDRIVREDGSTVQLRGTCVGGWLNMEDFINGFTGSEHGLRDTAASILGRAKAEFLFERMQHYFFGEDDIAFIKSWGGNTIRLPLNYRHFEDDENPFVYKEEGFQKLDAIVDLCEKHGVYIIFDLHAVQGWQNTHWHSDNDHRQSLFWHDKTYQDRFVALWEEFARRYKNRAVVAGYNLMNEPCSNTPHGDYPHTFFNNYKADWERLNRVNRRAVEAIRKIDPDHIIILEGDNYSKFFDGMEAPFADNLVYSSHNYTAAGFGPGPYPGIADAKTARIDSGLYWDRDKQRQVFTDHQGSVYAQKHKVPLWVGEFGSVYNGPEQEIPDRLRAMDDQISIFEEFGAHWTTWTYKDVGVMGLAMLDPESEYMQRIASIVEMKHKLNTDDWMIWLPGMKARWHVDELAKHLEKVIGDDDLNHAYNVAALSQSVLTVYTGALIQPAYVKLFKGLSEEKIDDIMASFALKNCKINHGLVDVLKKHTN
ncbi:glycoside hydrolase family 5 protein [Aquibacillus koreensis]|uniref:Glycoside hydrolase family 5 protein n=1 Tax=Aquibacillus koreensis TaxID=279446 RepID=A0A9X3WPA6_9BACI|nr:glycoside hydrolase family 5 protein [Aquibacillus koreensis]MCT2536656.1 glycoside hydrolase family 5 protein [Aquibacillus koreensis]MDC3422610.1 glycoside hydrolase family 5 protein [Aquibacillus koreensis]